MTTTNYFDEESDRIIAEGMSAVEAMRERARQIEEAKASQPERLAKARSDADEARGWSLIEEPFSEQCQALKSADGDTMLTIPNITAKELFGARLAFDLLDAGDDWDQVDTVLTRMFTTANGDTGLAFLLATSALSTIATLVVPELLNEIEQGASNWDIRVSLAEARAKSWRGRVSALREAQDEDDSGVNPINGYDIGATTLDPDDDVLGDDL